MCIVYFCISGYVEDPGRNVLKSQDELASQTGSNLGMNLLSVKVCCVFAAVICYCVLLILFCVWWRVIEGHLEHLLGFFVVVASITVHSHHPALDSEKDRKPGCRETHVCLTQTQHRCNQTLRSLERPRKTFQRLQFASASKSTDKRNLSQGVNSL